jgi:hypothetical protein
VTTEERQIRRELARWLVIVHADYSYDAEATARVIARLLGGSQPDATRIHACASDHTT